MKLIILDQPDRVGSWTMGQLGVQWFPGRGTSIGLMGEDGKLLAGVVYEGWNGRSLMMHVAAVPGARWMTKEYLHACFAYPFNQLGASKVIAPVEQENLASRRFVEHLGFMLEATLNEVCPSGDLLVYTMTKTQCPWINPNLRKARHGKTQLTAAPELRSDRL